MSNTKERILEAGSKAVEELIKVLEDKIIGNTMINDGTGKNASISADKMKQAASAKRLAFDDALYMYEKIEAESKTDEDKPIVKKIPTSFVESRAGGKQ